jgi:alkylation response protein AidB-like acyl-CoA dehydrogenase
MQFTLTDQQKKWQLEVEEFINEQLSPELLAEVEQNEDKMVGSLEKAYRHSFVEKGWVALNWPKEFGGIGLTAVEKFIFNEAIEYAGAPRPFGVGVQIVAPSIFRFGTEQNKKDWLPKIMESSIEFALGYSEPNAGSDLANLSTRCEIDGDELVINGQKTWNTFGHRVSHQWTAVRTDFEVPKHKGISVVIIPNDAPGVTLVKQKTWGNHTTNEVFFDNVRIPITNLVGQLNEGWRIITSALDNERVSMGSSARIRRIYEQLVQYCQETVVDGQLLIQQQDIQEKLADLYTELEVARLFGFRGAILMDSGKEISTEASMMKVFATELMTKVADIGLEIVAMNGQLNKTDRYSALTGQLEHLYRLAPFHRFGGGTNEVQKNIIAQRGLKLPRK